MDRWEVLVRRDVLAARNLHTTDLRNSLPKVLENLAQALESERKNARLEIKFAREHGKERSVYPQYTLEQVISEYWHLRRAIFTVLGDVSPENRDTIIDAIEIGISEAASEFAVQQYQLREQFVSMLAHDLRNPLTVAKTNAQLILRMNDISESVQVRAAGIVDTIDRTDSMIKDLLDSNLVQMGQKLPLEIESCDLQALTKIILADAASVYGDRFILKENSAITGYWDSSILQRAIGNLLSNAIKYGDLKNPVKITLTQMETQVQIAVHNDGNPIPAAELDNIFDNFYRAARSKGGRTQGWGIGLFLVKAAAVAHGGTVQLQSNEKEGTTFTIILPKDCRQQNGAMKNILSSKNIDGGFL